MNVQFKSHISLLEGISHCSWKEKIAFFSQISQEMIEERLQFSPKILQINWVSFLHETNINVLLKTLSCLNIFTKTYNLQSLRVQRDILHKLLELSKMKRKQINDNISDIICTLIAKQKETMSHGLQRPFSFCHESFSKSSQPTFLLGVNEDDPMDEEETQAQITVGHQSQQNSYILDLLLEELKGCRKEVLTLIAKVASRLIKDSILNEHELRALFSGIESVKNVIISRKCVQSLERAEIETEISEVLLELAPKY